MYEKNPNSNVRSSSSTVVYKLTMWMIMQNAAKKMVLWKAISSVCLESIVIIGV